MERAGGVNLQVRVLMAHGRHTSEQRVLGYGQRDELGQQVPVSGGEPNPQTGGRSLVWYCFQKRPLSKACGG